MTGLDLVWFVWVETAYGYRSPADVYRRRGDALRRTRGLIRRGEARPDEVVLMRAATTAGTRLDPKTGEAL